MSPNKEKPIYGWGYSDEQMFQELKNWINQHEQKNQTKPYFATLFTLSTHDPYIIPSTVKNENNEFRRWIGISATEEEKNINMINAFAYTDQVLQDFYQWFMKNEYDKDTLLIITSDHLPHQNIYETDNNEQFTIPLIVINKSTDKSKYSIDQLGSHIDIAPTILDLLDLSNHDCFIGSSLLSNDDKKLNDRYVISVSGDQLEKISLRNKLGEFHYSKNTDEMYTHFNKTLSAQEKLKLIATAKKIMISFLKINAELLPGGIYSYTPKISVEKIIPTEFFQHNKIIIASHRVNVSVAGNNSSENTSQSITNAIIHGFEWVEIDTQVTKENEFILFHDTFIEVSGKKFDIRDLTYEQIVSLSGLYPEKLEDILREFGSKINFLIEIKSPNYADDVLISIQQVSKLIKKFNLQDSVIVDTFNHMISNSLAVHCNCATALDTPYKKKLSPQILKHYKDMGLKWLYVHHSIYNEELNKNAHQLGLKIMVYTVNNIEIVSNWNTLPDGIITDSSEVKNHILISESNI